MTLLALTPETADFLTLWGFVAGATGCIVGVVGFGYTIYQVRKVKSAAIAAQEAAEAMLAKSKGHYGKFVGAFASRLLSSLDDAVNIRQWPLAAVRAKDLAELIASDSHSIPDAGTLASELRVFGQKFVTGSPAADPKFRKEKWNEFVLRLHARIDGINAPFQGGERGKANPTADGAAAEGDRAVAPPTDEGGTGELGSGESIPK